PLIDEVDDTIHRGLANALVVSGAGTGKPTDPEKVKQVKSAAGNVPVFIGSGVTTQSLPAFLNHADGFIVGTAFKRDGVASNSVDPKRVKEFMSRLG
ncbi:MAG TPA: BtpA/SgcQ family protein, partial [Tepidisphaeraceae bacterium]|nr:BtpA/SgcQ family protein [Tepidisphaeraceae bacterium]